MQEVLCRTSLSICGRPFDVFGYEGDQWFQVRQRETTYSEFNLDNLRPFIADNSICLDIGANVGVMTLAMAMLAPHGKVIAFEGSEVTHTALAATVAASGMSNIETYPVIIGQEGQSGIFYEVTNVRSSSHFRPMAEGGLKSKSIDSLNLPVVDFIKIDAEGGELDILEGARQTLQRCKPTVVMEFNSFAFVHFRDISPRQALKYIFSVFPKVSYFEGRVGKVMPVSNPERFLCDNLRENGKVDDLICSW